jgi:hypothetical protein
MIPHSVWISFPGRHVRVSLGFTGLRAAVVHGSAERQEGKDNEQKISDVPTGHGFLPGSGPNIQTAWEQGGSKKKTRMIVDAATERQTSSSRFYVKRSRSPPGPTRRPLFGPSMGKPGEDNA